MDIVEVMDLTSRPQSLWAEGATVQLCCSLGWALQVDLILALSVQWKDAGVRYGEKTLQNNTHEGSWKV